MLQSGYILLILAVIVTALGGVRVFAVLRLAVAAREANRRLREGGAEAGVLTAALQDAVRKLRDQERATHARAEVSERPSGEIIASLTSWLLVVGVDGEVRIMNPSGERLLGLSGSESGGSFRRGAWVWCARAGCRHGRVVGNAASDCAENGCAETVWRARRRPVRPSRPVRRRKPRCSKERPQVAETKSTGAVASPRSGSSGPGLSSSGTPCRIASIRCLPTLPHVAIHSSETPFLRTARRRSLSWRTWRPRSSA